MKIMRLQNLAATALVLQIPFCDYRLPQLDNRVVSPAPLAAPVNSSGASPVDVGGTLVAVAAAVIIGGVIAGASKRDHSSTGTVTSDIRLKRDVHLLVTLDSGMKIYSFKYLWSYTAYVGVMAQDLLANPAWRDAVVTSPNGFYAVNYGTLGLKMVTLEEWQAQGVASIKVGDRISMTKQSQALQPAL
jgi:hypothetical protein